MTNSMGGICTKLDNRTVRLEEFFDMKDSTLNENGVKIKQALTYLYEKNSKNPHLFKEFPDRGKKKLTIDCTTIPMGLF